MSSWKCEGRNEAMATLSWPGKWQGSGDLPEGVRSCDLEVVKLYQEDRQRSIPWIYSGHVCGITLKIYWNIWFLGSLVDNIMHIQVHRDLYPSVLNINFLKVFSYSLMNSNTQICTFFRINSSQSLLSLCTVNFKAKPPPTMPYIEF